MTRTRARADERNEATAEVFAARNRRLKDENEKLKAWRAERLQEDEETKVDRERLAGLIEDLADELAKRADDALEWGEGLSRRIMTDEDLLRIAELLNPDD